jgi:MurNAc alpha-1-phosphate uridylyltransferase
MLHVRAMILAAGRGERMRPLTDLCPKPLLPVRGKPLLQWHMEGLARGGFTDLVINTAWLGEQIPAKFGAAFELPGLGTARIAYSHEGTDFGGALETAGGIARALPLLCDSTHDVFWVLAGDVFAPGFAFTAQAAERFAASGKLAHLWLVPNPAHNPRGDFGLGEDGHALNLTGSDVRPRYTFSTIGLYRSALLAGLPAGNPQGIKAPLAPLLRTAMDNGQVSAELFPGEWTDVGTPERLTQLNATP